jgi:AcrR family transcriptional regulator|tara:strand:+ start:24 stop:611 length:588 start_codon:yes stop_codon:yes gene_type:complete
MNLSDRKLEERKQRKELILNGALEVFKRSGIEGATIDEIAIQSGFGKATLYYYFKSKEEVFSAILTNGWEKLWLDLEPTIAKSYDSPREMFLNLLLKISDNVKARPGLFEFLFNAPKKHVFDSKPWAKYQERIYSVIHTIIEEGIALGEFPNTDPKVLFKALGGLFMGLVLMGEKKVSKKDIEKMLNELIPNYKI